MAAPVYLIPEQLTVERRFVAHLARICASHALTMLIGPAGSGKSEALRQLARAVEANGDDAIMYVPVEARKTRAEDFTLWLTRATAEHARGRGPDADLHRSALVVFVDRYELLDSDTATAAIRRAVSADASVHLVIGARRTPGVTVADIHAHKAMFTLEPGALFFSPEEVAQLFGGEMPERQLRKVRHFTQGWPVAVRFIRDRYLGSPSKREPGKLILLDPGLMAFVEEHILRALPPELLDLLVDIAALECIQPPLVDHVRGRSDSARLLQDLGRVLPGLVQRDDTDDAEIFILAPAVRDYIQDSGRSSDEAMELIRRRAIMWYRDNLLFEHAIAQAMAANMVGVLKETLERIYIWQVFFHRGVSGLLAILRTLLPAEIAGSPRLRLMASLASFKSGFYQESCHTLEEIRQATDGFRVDPSGDAFALRRDATLIDICFATTLLGVQAEDSLFERAGRAADRDDVLVWATIELSRCVIFEMRGELSKALDAWRRCEAIVRGARNAHFTETWLPNHVPFIAMARGSYREASEFSIGIARRGAWREGEDVPSEAMARTVSAAIAYERRFVEEAGDQLRDALDLLGRGSNWFAPCALSYPIMFEVAHRTCGGAGVTELAAELRDQSASSGIADLPEMVDALEAGWLLRAGQADDAALLIEKVKESASREGALPWRLFDAQQTALFHWAWARDEISQASLHSKMLIDAGRTGGRLRTMAKGRLLKAVATERMGDRENALKETASVLGMTAHEQMVALFAEEGRLISELVAHVAADSSATAVSRRHAAAVLRVLPLAKGDKMTLSEREAEIVLHLRDGASNKLIARRLGLSENTIKFHMKKIFAKLGVTSRKAAALVIRDLDSQ